MFIKSLLNKTLLATSAAAFVAMMATPVANAGSSNANLLVTATVQTACAFGTVLSPATSFPLSFGIFSIGTGGDKDVAATVDVECAAITPFTLRAGGTPGSRTMSDGGTGTLIYDIYTDAGRTIPMGNTVANQISSPGSSGITAVSIFGRIPQAGNALAPLGTYTDTVLLTLTF
jgi:spore coat protein U-like protein